MAPNMTKDELEFLLWKVEREERARKVGAYWLTTEGRAEIRDSFTDHDDGNCVLPLLDYVERLEQRLAELRGTWERDLDYSNELQAAVGGLTQTAIE